MTASVTVLGAGIVGILTALSLAERGIKVTLVDRGEPGQATSSGNAGVISPWSITPQAMPGVLQQLPKLLLGRERPLGVRGGQWPKMACWGTRFLMNGNETQVRRTAQAMFQLCQPSVRLYRQHLAGTGAEDLICDSMYVHAFRRAEKADLDALDYRIRREFGASLELVGADSLRQIEPALSPDFKAAVLTHGQARTLSPGRLGKVLSDKAQALGVKLLRRNIIALQPVGDGWSVVCDEGNLQTPTVIITLGVWSTELLRPLGVDLPLMAERGYHVELPNPGLNVANSVMDVDCKFVASSMEDGLRAAGHAEFAAPDDTPDPQRQARLLRQAKAALPDLDISGARYWTGSRPSFPDGIPVLGAIDGRPGLYAGFGHSHHGLMMAPQTGEVLADLVSGRAPGVDLAGLTAARFSNTVVKESR